ncbi:ABC transporter glutamine-binding protein GlnH [Elysia marginata]|uniref:ABC transporter glutamine-binding protein GlnH n=1 Tax=Elysia marginata TaxID=1093978 RepID=A0AAV4FQ86_9GAST|nr:ABC transporter glutamine-binding protein GlnH [Elysia marginata]
MTQMEPKRLRLLTYMCPDIPVSTFAFLRNCIEEVTELETDLIVEDRFKGPTAGRANPFTEDLADIVALHSTNYLQLKEQNQEHMELCTMAPVFQHPHAGGKPVYFSEIIIHTRNKDKYKTILDLKGCGWAYNDKNSLSGNVVVLNHLKRELKTNATHFGTIVESGSHLNSIKMVRDATVEAAAVDSAVLAGYLQEHEEDRDTFVSLASLGPLPIFPFLFNDRLPGKIKDKITQEFLALNTISKWEIQLKETGIEKFTSVTKDLYCIEQELLNGIKGMSINTAYY